MGAARSSSTGGFRTLAAKPHSLPGARGPARNAPPRSARCRGGGCGRTPWACPALRPRLPRARQPSGEKNALLTLVNLTSRLRTGRGRTGGFLSGCPFSTAPLVVAMAPLHSGQKRLGDAQPAPGVTAPRRFMELPTPPASGTANWLPDEGKGGQTRRAGRGPARLTPPRPSSRARNVPVRSWTSSTKHLLQVPEVPGLGRWAGSGRGGPPEVRSAHSGPHRPRFCQQHLLPLPGAACGSCPTSAGAPCSAREGALQSRVPESFGGRGIGAPGGVTLLGAATQSRSLTAQRTATSHSARIGTVAIKSTRALAQPWELLGGWRRRPFPHLAVQLAPLRHTAPSPAPALGCNHCEFLNALVKPQ